MKHKAFLLFLMVCLVLFLFPVPETQSEIVSETSTWHPIRGRHQENAFIWNGRAYVFYQDGYSFYYRHRTNLTTWSKPQEISSVQYISNYTGGAILWSVWLEKDGSNGYLHYAKADGFGIYRNCTFYRKGELTDNGSISWLANEQIIYWGGGIFNNYEWVMTPHICTDSEGYPWIVACVFKQYDGGAASWYTFARRSSTKNGSWTTDEEKEWWYDEELEYDNAYTVNRIVPMADRKVMIASIRGDCAQRFYYFNGSIWHNHGTEMVGLVHEFREPANTPLGYADQFKWSMIGFENSTGGSEVHCVYNRLFGGNYFFAHVKWQEYEGDVWQGNWTGIEGAYQGGDPPSHYWDRRVSPQLQLFEANYHMRCSWLEYDGTTYADDKIFYRDWNGTGWSDAALWFTETQDIDLDEDDYIWVEDYGHENFAAIYSDDGYWAISYKTIGSTYVEFLSEPPDLSETQIILSVSSSPEINAPFTLNSTEYTTPESLNFTQEDTYTLTATFSVVYASNTYEFSHIVFDGTAYYTMSLNILMNVSHTVVLHYNLKATPPPIPYIYSPLDPNMTWYFRSDTHTINGVLGYKLADTNTYTEINDTRTYSGSHTTSYGVRVWIMDTGGDEDELTSGSPVATVTRSGDGSGIQSNSWNSQDYLSVIDAVVVRVYQRWDSESWSLRKIFVSHDELLWRIPTCTWTFYYYTTLQNGNTSIFSFGSSTFNSRVDFQYERINPFETQAYYLAKLDLFAFTFTPWTYHIGDLFWGLMLLFMLVTTYNRYHSIKPVIAVCWLFGGAGGVLSTMIPATALQLSWLLLAFALAATLFRLMR